MTTRVLTAAWAALLGGAIAGCGGAKATDVVDVSVVTTLPKEVGPGGFDRTIAANGVASGYFFKAALSDCGQAVDSVVGAWAAQHGLVAGTRTVDPRSVTLEFTSQPPGAPAGTFTVFYARGAESADVRVTFRGTDGAQPLTSADLGRLGMEALVDGLLGAAQCDGASAS
jgi:hypothetical protein